MKAFTTAALIAVMLASSAGAARAQAGPDGGADGRARPALAPPQPAHPLGSPGAWILAADYPVAGLRLRMEGITTFRLTIDPAGKPARCDITISSGFDVLDTATCERLMANAAFAPATDAQGRAVPGTYANRVRWVLPQRPQVPTLESSATFFYRIDQAGAIQSCQLVVKTGGPTPFAGASACDAGVLRGFQPAAAREMRGPAPEPVAAVEVELSTSFSPAVRDANLVARPGYELRAAAVFRFTVGADGKIAECKIEQQRGSDQLVHDFCVAASREIFQPPAGAAGADGTVTGWRVQRIWRRIPT